MRPVTHKEIDRMVSIIRKKFNTIQVRAPFLFRRDQQKEYFRQSFKISSLLLVKSEKSLWKCALIERQMYSAVIGEFYPSKMRTKRNRTSLSEGCDCFWYFGFVSTPAAQIRLYFQNHVLRGKKSCICPLLSRFMICQIWLFWSKITTVMYFFYMTVIALYFFWLLTRLYFFIDCHRNEKNLQFCNFFQFFNAADSADGAIYLIFMK